MVKCFDVYHDEGLKILGVSLDIEKWKDVWLKAIDKDRLFSYPVFSPFMVINNNYNLLV
ncbi:MAG: hypothetical protein M0Q53_11235 [Prolixibacteraceae bacterium]|jgi:hypothetical protein|nr:hypothetical protein [Prolixibacteraceae bacterium]